MTDTAQTPRSIALAARPPGLVERTAARVGVDPDKLLATLKATAFRTGTDKTVSNEQMLALLAVAERHNLDPFTKEIYAYPDKGGGIVPVIGVDGWIRKANEHPEFDGWGYEYDPKEQAGTCTIYRKDRTHPTAITEYVAECRRDTPPWKQSPRRMIRNRAIAQCVRLAFGFAGIHDDDEAQSIVEGERPASAASRVRAALNPQAAAPAPLSAFDTIDMETGETAPPPFGDNPRPLFVYIGELSACDDAEAAALVLDHARTALDANDFEVLAGAYRARFTPQENEE
jgi:phage recombination protein Bet